MAVRKPDLVTEMPISGGKLPPISLPTNCPGCGVGLEVDSLRAHNYVCDCGHHFRMHADAWIALIADAGSWEERWADIRPHDLLEWRTPKPYQETIRQLAEEGLNEAVRTGVCTVAGQPAWLGVFDFRFVGGTLSIVAGERLARALEQAAASGHPFVLVAASGGARMQEGVLALMQMAKVNGAVGRLDHSGAPFFSILTDPTFGGTAASIVWRDNSRKVEAAEQLQLTSRDLLAMGVVEEIVPEPEGGAHTDHGEAARLLDAALWSNLEPLFEQPSGERLQHRYERFRYIDSLIKAEPHFGPKVE